LHDSSHWFSFLFCLRTSIVLCRSQIRVAFANVLPYRSQHTLMQSIIYHFEEGFSQSDLQIENVHI
jgi:hypothetical protein